MFQSCYSRLSVDPYTLFSSQRVCIRFRLSTTSIDLHLDATNNFHTLLLLHWIVVYPLTQFHIIFGIAPVYIDDTTTLQSSIHRPSAM